MVASQQSYMTMIALEELEAPRVELKLLDTLHQICGYMRN